MNHSEIINYLRDLDSLDLTTFPIQKIKSIITKIGLQGNSAIFVQPGHWVSRARINETSESFQNINDLSYKPEAFNQTYQRASTPNKTMFYGCIAPEQPRVNELDLIKMGVAAETSNLVFDEDNVPKSQKITISYWRVVDIFMLVLIAKYSDIEKGNPEIHNSGDDRVYAKFKGSISDNKTIHAISNYYANQFSKSGIRSESDYLISSIFSEFVLSHKGFSGVYYPSIHSQYGCFNIAVKPETIDKCIQFSHVHECTLYKKGNFFHIDIDKAGKKNKNGKIEYEIIDQASKNTMVKVIHPPSEVS